MSVSSASQTELNGEQRVACTLRWVCPYTLNRERELTTMQLPSELQEATLFLLKIPGMTLFLGFFFNLRAKGYPPSWFPTQNKPPPLPLSPSFSSFYSFQWQTTHASMFLHYPWLLQSYITYRIWTSWLWQWQHNQFHYGRNWLRLDFLKNLEDCWLALNASSIVTFITVTLSKEQNLKHISIIIIL